VGGRRSQGRVVVRQSEEEAGGEEGRTEFRDHWQAGGGHKHVQRRGDQVQRAGRSEETETPVAAVSVQGRETVARVAHTQAERLPAWARSQGGRHTDRPSVVLQTARGPPVPTDLGQEGRPPHSVHSAVHHRPRVGQRNLRQ